MTPSPERKGFSDEDLKRLKEHTLSDCPCAFVTDDIPKLLARLEAAEAICRIVERTGDGSLWKECEAWRRSKGESE